MTMGKKHYSENKWSGVSWELNELLLGNDFFIVVNVAKNKIV